MSPLNSAVSPATSAGDWQFALPGRGAPDPLSKPQAESGESSAVALQRAPQRWDVPFSTDMKEADVDRLLRLEPFVRMDPLRFPAALPLRGILQNDARILRPQAGDLIVREGDYGHSAFLILSGSVRVCLESLPPALLGRGTPHRKSWWQAVSQLLQGPQPAESRPVVALADSPLGIRQSASGTHVFLQDVPGVLKRHQSLKLQAGELFGELAALARTPRTATVFAEGDCELLELRWQGLKELLRRAPAFKQQLDGLYRQNSLLSHLRETPLLAALPANDLQQLANETEFETYGDFDWHWDFQKHHQIPVAERLEREPVIAEEAHLCDGLILIRSGFARVSVKHGTGQQTVSYLGKGQIFGSQEVASILQGGSPRWQSSLRAVGYVDVLKIPLATCKRLLPTALARFAEASVASAAAHTALAPQSVSASPLHTPMLEFLMDHRLVNGTQAMVIDLDRCTRCDDCVRACAATHDGNPRFVRQGPTQGRFMFAEACLHCVDPVCLIGCPTGAIGRHPSGGMIQIHEPTCIGCGTCATSCPYSAIRMVEISTPQGLTVIDEVSGKAVLKATKCDLCVDQRTGPACQQACAHDALQRLDLQTPLPLSQFTDRT